MTTRSLIDSGTLPTSVAEALAAGIPEHRLRAADLAAPFHGVRLPRGDEHLLVERCRALVTKMRPGDAFTGPTAAMLWGIPLPRPLADPIAALHVSSVLPVRPLRRNGVVGSLREDGHETDRNGLPALPPLRSWFSLSRFLSLDDLVAAADFLITGDRGAGPLARRDDLVSFAGMMSRHPGAPRARAAAEASRVGAWSRPESLLRLLVIRAGLPEPVLNIPLAVPDGSVLIPDLAWPGPRLAVEYNGAGHEDEAQHRRDLRRLDAYAEIGWRALNVDSTELFGSRDSLAIRIQRAHAAQCAKSVLAGGHD